MKMRPRYADLEPPEVTPAAPVLAEAWVCIDCDQKATKIHKGTGYCAEHYRERNLYGRLIN